MKGKEKKIFNIVKLKILDCKKVETIISWYIILNI